MVIDVMKMRLLLFFALMLAALLLSSACDSQEEEHDIVFDPVPIEEGPEPLGPMPIQEWAAHFGVEEGGPIITVYFMSLPQFRDFVESADRSLLYGLREVDIYRTAFKDELVIRAFLDHMAGDELIEEHSMGFDLPGAVMDFAFLQRYGSVQCVEEIMLEQGISRIVEDFFIISRRHEEQNDIPLSLVAYTDSEVYFIELYQFGAELDCTVFTHAEFIENNVSLLE